MIVSWDVPAPPVTVAGVNDQLACVAVNPPSDSETAPAKPFSGDTETVYDTAPPAVVDADDGDTLIPKSEGGTTSVALVVCVTDPLVPVIVSG